MIPILAKEAVIIKSKNSHAMLLGNYEIAYAIGVMYNLTKQEILKDYSTIDELLEHIRKILDDYNPQNDNEKNIVKMLKECKIRTPMEEQAKELLQMGLDETKFWII